MTRGTCLPDGLIAVLFGSALAWVVLGPSVIDPFAVSWLKADPADSYIGWSFFRRESTWHLPLLHSDSLGYPLGVSTAYWDIIPPLALIFRLLSPLLPVDFQYFGPYGLVCCVLQVYFGLKWARRLAPERPPAGIAAALFIGTAPPLMFRLYAGHFALASHWLILAALLCLQDSRQGRRFFARLFGLTMLAAAINPYLLAMLLLIALGALGNAGARGGQGAGEMLTRFSLLLGCSVAVMSILGFIILGDAAYSAGGYIQCSMNLLAPFNPMNFPSVLLPTLPVRFERQYEGYNYLGAGLLSLGVTAVAYRPVLLRESLANRFTAERGIIVISLLLALSVYATVGSRVIYYMPLPDPILHALASFRASGRLFWPAYYIVMAGLLAAGLRAFPHRWGTAVVFAALLLQLADTASLWAATRARWADPPTSSPLRDAAWAGLGQHSRHLVVLPAWQCDSIKNNLWVTPGGVDGYQIFGNLALAQHMTLNSFYASRVSDAQRRFFCHDQAARLQAEGPQPDTAYVFNPDDTLAQRLGESSRVLCRPLDGFLLCTPR